MFLSQTEQQQLGGASGSATLQAERQLSSNSGFAAVQLTELLRRRNVAEAAADAGRRAQLAEKLFQVERKRTDELRAEVSKLCGKFSMQTIPVAALTLLCAVRASIACASASTSCSSSSLFSSRLFWRQVSQLRLVASEAEQAAADAAAALRDETRRAQRDQTLVRGELDAARKQTEVRYHHGLFKTGAGTAKALAAAAACWMHQCHTCMSIHEPAETC